MENKTKVCMFIGHRSLMHSIEVETAECIRRLIVEDGVREFWYGGMGRFDALCAGVVRRLKGEFPDVRLVLVLPSMSARAMTLRPEETGVDEILIPDASDGAHFKRAITLRNRWMAENCTVAVAYVQRDHGGAYTAARYAARMKKPLLLIRESPQIRQRLFS